MKGKDMSNKPHIFRNNVAAYNSLTQTVHLNNVNREDVESFNALLHSGGSKNDVATLDGVKKIIRPMVHELRHWVDMNCSIKGLDSLSSIYKLALSLEPSNPEIPKLKRELGLSCFVERAASSVPQPWRHSFRYSKPLYHESIEHLSICFHAGDDVKGKENLFKTPIYLGSMLECCAYQQEHKDALPLMAGNAFWPAEKRRFKKEELEFVYDSTLAEYHALAHAFASCTKELDIRSAYEFSSGICFWLLNMPDEMLRKTLKEVDDWAVKKNLHSVFRTLSASWPREAIIYYSLIALRQIAATTVKELQEDMIYDLLPVWKTSRKEYAEKSHEQFCIDVEGLKKLGFDYFNQASSALIENNKSILEQKTLNPTLLGLKYPPVFCGDFETVGASEFSGLEEHYFKIPENEIAELIEIKRR
jgi:hypothetical protein